MSVENPQGIATSKLDQIISECGGKKSNLNDVDVLKHIYVRGAHDFGDDGQSSRLSRRL